MASWTGIGIEISSIEKNVVLLQILSLYVYKRYEKADEEPPKVIYADRDCCYENGPSKLKVHLY